MVISKKIYYLVLIQLIAAMLINTVLSATDANAAPRRVKESQVVNSAIKYRGKNIRFACLGRTAGTTKKVSSYLLFSSYTDQIRKLTRRKDKNKKATLTAIAKLATARCKILSTSTPTPTPTPTAEPTFEPGNFDSNGNVTEQGKSLFEIPSHLSANISLGRDVYQSYCVGCHIEQVNRTFPYIRTSIANPPMNYNEIDLPDPELANLIAYLNRFRF